MSGLPAPPPGLQLAKTGSAAMPPKPPGFISPKGLKMPNFLPVPSPPGYPARPPSAPAGIPHRDMGGGGASSFNAAQDFRPAPQSMPGREPMPPPYLSGHPGRDDNCYPPRPYDSRDPARPYDSREPPRPYYSREPPRPYDSREPPRPYDSREPPRPYDGRDVPRPFDNRGPPESRGWYDNRDPRGYPMPPSGPPLPPPGSSAPPYLGSSAPLYPPPPGMHDDYRGGPDPFASRDGYSSARDRDYDDQMRNRRISPPQSRIGGGGDRRGGRRSSRFDGDVEEPLREPTNTVWVGNLDLPHMSDDLLRNTFHRFGKVMLISRAPGKSFCFLHFRRVEEAKRAVDTLMASGELGKVRFNYAKMFQYTPEEMNEPWDPTRPPLVSEYERRERRLVEEERMSRGRMRDRDCFPAGGRAGADDDRMSSRRSRADDPPGREPTNILWVGNLPPSVTAEDLEEQFKGFGKINNISRPDGRNMAFVYFDTKESCRSALSTMRGTVIGGAHVTLNYGSAPRNPAAAFSNSVVTGAAEFLETLPDLATPEEKPSNVVYMNQVPSSVRIEEVEELFDRFEGLIDCKLLNREGVAFGHFTTVETASACRAGLQGIVLGGAKVFVTFGKTSHNKTMADRYRCRERKDDDLNLPISMPGAGDGDASSTALVVGSSSGLGSGDSRLVVPKMGMPVGLGDGGHGGSRAMGFGRPRASPIVTLDVRIQSLKSASYNECGEVGSVLVSSLIQSLCDTVDACICDESSERLYEFISKYCPLHGAHVFSVMAKRLVDHYDGDSHKKLLVLYAATRVLLTAVPSGLTYTKASLDAFLVLLAVVGDNQCSSGVEKLSMIIHGLRNPTFLAGNKMDEQYEGVFTAQLDSILERAKADQDLTSMLVAKRRRTA